MISVLKTNNFMKAYENTRGEMQTRIEGAAMKHYGEAIHETAKKIPEEDLPFLINALRWYISACKQVAPKKYEKALKILPEENILLAEEACKREGGE